jgi:hypothetical protein
LLQPPSGRSTRTCLVCDLDLSSVQRLQRELFCGSQCRANYTRLTPNQVCRFCGRPLRPDRLASGICSGKECQLQFAVKIDEDNRQSEREAIKAASEAVYEQVSRRESTAGYPLAIIPYNPRPLGPLAADRRQALGEHIAGLLDALVLDDATRQDPSSDSPSAVTTPQRSPALLSVFSAACSICQGHCCRTGGDQAYLDTKTIDRYRRSHPEASPMDVLAAYLTLVGDTTYVGSCVYHQADGCSLPRAMRSDTCNRFYCSDLLAFEKNADDPPRAFFAAISEVAVQAAAFVTENQIRVVNPVVDSSSVFSTRKSSGSDSVLSDSNADRQ